MPFERMYYCTHCGANLNWQDGFRPSVGVWTCRECGMLMLDPDVYDFLGDVIWYCDNCGDVLNIQDGFRNTDGWWRCTKCGHINGTTEADILSVDTPEIGLPT